ncbi:MAG: S-layer homology domain-containing protein [Clostridia bacterium]|nr:S-layer homology domain-containing protein [Clostridia bacterium]
MSKLKKITSLSAFILCFTLLLSGGTCLFARPDYVRENPPIDVPNKTPTVDGYIRADEGWSSYAALNYDTLGYFWHVNPLTTYGNICFTYDTNGFYYAANIVEGLEAVNEITGETIPAGYNEFIYSTGYDDIDVGDDGSGYGWNGDVFCLMLDPLGLMLEYGFNMDPLPCYMVGLFEGDVARMYREEFNVGEITNQVKVKGHKTEKGWTFEACIPWSVIINDIKKASWNEISLNKNEILKSGALIKAAASYHDRFYDTVVDQVATWGHFVTVPTTMADGTAGYMGRGDIVMSCGLTLYMGDRTMSTGFSDVKPSAWYYAAVTSVVKNGYMNGMSDTVFSPHTNITREQFVQILANIAGANTEEYKYVNSGFKDVPTGRWYSGAVAWAVERGYVSGMSATTFGTGHSIQRAALARMLYNYAAKNGIDIEGRGNLSVFADAREFDKEANYWMVEPMLWAVDAGIISGMNMNGKLCANPKGTATRAQAAVMLMKFDDLMK